MNTQIELGKLYVNFRGDRVRMNGHVLGDDGTPNYFLGDDGCPYQPNGDFIGFDGNRHETLSIQEEYIADVFSILTKQIIDMPSLWHLYDKNDQYSNDLQAA